MSGEISIIQTWIRAIVDAPDDRLGIIIAAIDGQLDAYADTLNLVAANPGKYVLVARPIGMAGFMAQGETTGDREGE